MARKGRGVIWKQLKENSKFDERLAALAKFNASNRFKKRGIPTSYALAEHCDPVLAKANSQASWDHDACRLRSLPDIPD